DVIDHVSRPLGIGDDVVANLPHLSKVQPWSIEELPPRRRVDANGGQRLPKLMRDRGRELAHHGKTSHVRHLAVGLLSVSRGAGSLDGPCNHIRGTTEPGRRRWRPRLGTVWPNEVEHPHGSSRDDERQIQPWG